MNRTPSSATSGRLQLQLQALQLERSVFKASGLVMVANRNRALLVVTQAFPPGDETLTVSRNLTLSSCNGLSTQAILDFRSIQGRIRLRPGVTVTFSYLILKNPRSRAGFGYDILLNSEGANVVSSTAPDGLQLVFRLLHSSYSRPSASQGLHVTLGLNTSSWPRNLCVSGTTALSSTWCLWTTQLLML